MKKKLVKVFATMICAAIVLTAILLSLVTHRLFEQRVFEDMRIEARMLAQMVESNSDVLDILSGELRVTLLDAQGAVLLDNTADSSQMENHAKRPEVAAALAQGEGTHVRRSSTMQCDTYYYAVRLEDGSVLRLGEEASGVVGIYVQAAPAVLVLLALMLGLCVVATNVITRRLLRPIAQMTEQLDEETPVVAYPELEPFMNMIRKQHQEILRSADVRVQFTANVSHELKTPLTSISGYAELIESGMAKGEQAQRFAGEIRKSTDRLLTLINDIIRLSQMDSPTSAIQLEPVDLQEIAVEVTQQLRVNAQKTNVTLTLEARSAVIQADRRMMEELLYNLCDNAIRYNVPGGSVRVEIRPLREQVIVCVQDTGIGISMENQTRVFERFYRVDKSRSKATGGTGLGLAIVKHIAAQHGAQLHLESELGHGTAITVTFARREPHEGR